jgi:hypothetical protein
MRITTPLTRYMTRSHRGAGEFPGPVQPNAYFTCCHHVSPGGVGSRLANRNAMSDSSTNAMQANVRWKCPIRTCCAVGRYPGGVGNWRLLSRPGRIA